LTRSACLTLGIAAATAALAFSACGPRPSPAAQALREPGRPIVLVTVDTLRADHLGIYGYGRDTSPNIDSLARRSIVFRNAVSQWPATSPSISSLFTSSYVHANRTVRRTRGFVLPDEAETLAEILVRQGYQTVAVSANGALSPEYNFHQGFERFVLPYKVLPDLPIEESVRADHTTDLALELLRGLDLRRPFLLWVHYLDPHMSYSAPEPYRSRFVDAALQHDEVTVSCSPLNSGGREHRKGRRRCPRSRLVARYDGEIAFVDHEIERLLRGLDEARVLERALTVFTADHGEALGEDKDYFGHSRSVRQSEVRVPLFFHLPGAVTAGQVVASPVDLVDLAPTVLSLVGLARGAAMRGDDLSALVLGEARPAPRYAFTEAGSSDNYMRAVVGERYKLIQVPDRRERRLMAGTPLEVYDLASDPLETHNLWPEREDIVTAYLPVLEAWRAEGARSDAAPPPEEGEVAPDTVEQLRALGYINN